MTASLQTGRLQIRILGCGSSGGVPRIGGDWGACDPAEPRNRRSRCSVLLRAYGAGPEPTVVLIDTSPDMREQLLAARVDRVDEVLLTHEHADQLHGIDDLRALVIRHRKRVPVHMDAENAKLVVRRFDYCFESQAGYPAILDAKVDLKAGQATELGGPGGPVEVLTVMQDHGSRHSLGFRVADFAYCNDVVRIPDESLELLGGLDLLVVDALRYAAHPTHANLDQALRWIETLKPRRAVLTNLHVDLDYRRLRAELPDGVEPAFDGMELETVLNR